MGILLLGKIGYLLIAAILPYYRPDGTLMECAALFPRIASRATILSSANSD